MRRPTLDEKRVYGKIVADAARIANLELANRQWIDTEYAIEGRFTLDRNRQPSFLLEPTPIYADYEFPAGTRRLLDTCLRLVIDRDMDELLTLTMANVFSTPTTKTKATKPTIDQERLFD